MIALVTLRTDQDWYGFATVIALLVLIALWSKLAQHGVFWLDEWLVRRDALRVTEALAHGRGEPDHADCANPDCEETICRCSGPAECTGCTTLGCDHGEGLCWDCRLGCGECVAEHDAEQFISWVSGR